MKPSYRCLSLVLMIANVTAWGWGKDGHRNICHEAVDLLQQMGGDSNPLQACLIKNIDFFTLAGSSPDEHFKMGMAEGGLIRRLQAALQWSNTATRAGMSAADQAEAEKAFNSYDLGARIRAIEARNQSRIGETTKAELAELKKTLECYDHPPSEENLRAECDRLKEKNPSLDDKLALLCKKKAADSTEHHNHFLQLDFIVPGLLAQLDDDNPAAIEDYVVRMLRLSGEDVDFTKGYPKMRQLIGQNFEYVNKNVPWDMKIDPDFPRDKIAEYRKAGKEIPMVRVQTDALKDKDHVSLAEVERQGTAQYRVSQLYDAAVKSLKDIKAGNSAQQNADALRKAFFYLGILCHYEGDKGQPFHASGATYDGQSLPGAKGVHHSFEEGILEQEATEQGQKDGDHALWKIKTVHEGVQKAAKEYLKASDTKGGIKSLNRLEILSEDYRQVASGFKYVDPIQHAFVDTKKKLGISDTAAAATSENNPHLSGHAGVDDGHEESKTAQKKKAEAAFEHAFKETSIAVKGRGTMTIMEAANERMGRAAGLLARMYKSAISEATNGDLSTVLSKNCDPIPYTAQYAITNYPPHDYIDSVATTADPAPKRYNVDIAACSRGERPPTVDRSGGGAHQ